MALENLFTARAVESNVLLSCYGYTCRVFGASIPVSALRGEEARSFTVRLPEGQDCGLIAVAVNHSFNGKAVWSGYVLALTRGDDGRAFVDLDHPWVPAGEQIIQIDHLGLHLTDVASGHRFTTANDIVNRHNTRHVPDGDLLMRCLAGTATVDEVRAAAQAHAEERSARERLAEIEPRVARVEALAAEVGVALADLGTEYRRLREIEQRARMLRDEIQMSDQRDLQIVLFGTTYCPLFAALDAPRT